MRAVPGGWVVQSERQYTLALSRSEALALYLSGQARQNAAPGYEPLFQNGANPFPADAEPRDSV